jgi:hypothetical protein
MAINRAPFNALVDDSGNGLTGSIWNKAAIQNVLLDPIDAIGAWTPVAFNAANFWAGVLTSHVPVNRYAVIGKTLLWTVQVLGAPAPATPTAQLPFTIPAGLTMPTPGATAVFMPTAYAGDGAGSYTGQLAQTNNSPTGVQAGKLYPSVGTNWTGACYCYFTAIIALV